MTLVFDISAAKEYIIFLFLLNDWIRTHLFKQKIRWKSVINYKNKVTQTGNVFTIFMYLWDFYKIAVSITMLKSKHDKIDLFKYKMNLAQNIYTQHKFLSDCKSNISV